MECTHHRYTPTMACVATWSFGLAAVEAAAQDIKAGKDCIDVLEKAVNGNRRSRAGLLRVPAQRGPIMYSG